MKGENKLKVVVVGANGFIGKNLSFELSKFKNLDIYLISRKFDSFFKNKLFDRVNFSKTNYLDDSVSKKIENADYIYFLVSTSVPSTSWNNPIDEINSNIVDTIKFFKKCITNNVKNIIYLSSGGTIYGNQKGKLSEESNVAPFSPYGISKLAVERYLEYFRIKEGLNYLIYRVSNVYGPNSTRENFGVINTWLKKIYKKEKIKIYGSENITKDYIFVSDLVSILAKSINTDFNTSQIINLCSGNPVSLIDIVNTMHKILDVDFEYEIDQIKQSDNLYVDLDNSKLLTFFPKHEFIRLEKGIEKTWNYISTINYE